MKKTLIICLCMIFAGLAMQSCGPDDLKIQTEVKNALLLTYPQTSSSVRSGIVTLTGIVDSEEKRVDAEKVASEINGVKSVVNNIEVKKSQGEINRDYTLKATITNALFEAKITTVTVDVKDQVATLKGEIKKGDQKRILEMVKKSGAVNTVDSLTLK